MADRPIFPGFDPELDSVEDYILGTTRALWEDRELTELDSYFTSDVIYRDATLVTHGTGPIHQDILATIAAFPDLALLGEDVIWCEAGATDGASPGFYASQRATATATHSGYGLLGAPTGTPVSYRVMTDGWFADGKGRDLWRVRDTGGLLRQLGTAPKDWVAERLEGDGLPVPLVPDTDPEGPYPERGVGTSASEDFEATLRSVMAGDFRVFSDHYDRACEVVHPGGQTGIGKLAAEKFWSSLRCAFPSSAFRVEHVTGLSEPGHPDRVAMRWSLYGKHDGPGLFGPATGSFVYIMGITHAEFSPRGVRREWSLIDESAIWTQILGS